MVRVGRVWVVVTLTRVAFCSIALGFASICQPGRNVLLQLRKFHGFDDAGDNGARGKVLL
jgi:hypothetical protein